MTSSVKVTVNVEDINDQNPTFPSSSIVESVNETSQASVNLVHFQGSDGDQNSLLKYSIHWGESSGRDGNQKPVNISLVEVNLDKVKVK